MMKRCPHEYYGAEPQFCIYCLKQKPAPKPKPHSKECRCDGCFWTWHDLVQERLWRIVMSRTSGKKPKFPRAKPGVKTVTKVIPNKKKLGSRKDRLGSKAFDDWALED